MKQMVIANRLGDGIVVFLGPGDSWEPWIGAGRVLDEAEAEPALAVAKRHEIDNLVVEPSLIEVTVDESGVLRPVAVREAIRAFGPTVGTEQDGGKNHSAAPGRG